MRRASHAYAYDDIFCAYYACRRLIFFAAAA